MRIVDCYVGADSRACGYLFSLISDDDGVAYRAEAVSQCGLDACWAVGHRAFCVQWLADVEAALLAETEWERYERLRGA